jgi:hypothetical protein
MVECPKCGYKDPFMRSWFDPDKEVAEFDYFKDWNLELWERLQKGDVERDGYIYHLTKKSVERWKIEAWKLRASRYRGYCEGGRRKNYHIIGKRVVNHG